MRRRLPAICLVGALGVLAHEGMRNLGPTKATADLKAARQAMEAAKRKLVSQGRYSCCTRTSCSLCARVNGSCNCAANVQAGGGSCGECYAGWKSGRGSVAGVKAGAVGLLTADHQSCPRPAAPGEAPDDALRASGEALLRAKRILASEKRYACCIRGGCSQCAHEGYCPCGGDLTNTNLTNTNLTNTRKGVCGECLDRWRAGQGAFDGIDPAEVTLAMPGADMDSMRPTGASSASWYSSGTSQVPAGAPINMLSRLLGGWTIMGGGQIFGVYSSQTGPRGRDKMYSTNWAMAMASHRAGPGVFALHTMFSAEAATITQGRYPLLFATGETARGIPIINGQHPHDFVMELAASYKINLGERTAIRIYGGPRGEPALGPTAYPHRSSASENPVAVISHHLQDSTHIATNVVTLGATHGPVTWEVSGFHGREPDEKRWGIEGGAPDSLSTRLTISPTPRWSGQFSMGRINRGETTHPLRPALRSTASLMYARPMATGSWTTSLIWGRNHELEYTQLPNLPVFQPRHIVSVPTRIPGQIFNSFVIESTVRWHRHWIWGRAESADKDSTILFEEEPFVLLVDETRLARVQAYTAGYERELPSWSQYLSTGIGAQFTVYHTPPQLSPIYGANPKALQMFLRLRLAGPR